MADKEHQSSFGTDRGVSPVFVVGMPRSGTTYLYLRLVGQSDRVAGLEETHALEAFWRPHQGADAASFLDSYLESKWFKQGGLDKAQVREIFEDREEVDWSLRLLDALLIGKSLTTGKDIIVEKTPGAYEHVERLLLRYPQSRIIFLWRDARAVVSSLLKAPWAGDDWLMHTYRWKRCYRFFVAVAEHPRVRTVRYEDLIAEPTRTLIPLIKWISGIAPDHVNAGETPNRSAEGTGWEREHYAAATKAADKSRIEAWRTELPGRVSKGVFCLCRVELSALYPDRINLDAKKPKGPVCFLVDYILTGIMLVKRASRRLEAIVRASLAG